MTPDAERIGIAVGVVGFWVLAAAVLLTVWWVRRRRAARPEVQAHVEHEHREHLRWLDRLRTEEEQPTLDLPGITRIPGKHRRQTS